ncbi:hypothetical protein HF086_001145 [Spodoptera exigua]|uniref:Uncharacterized protein n=1 Tax=Spodoptera exigua TaxID=7107 RepID=A0A922M241_SPOEX|nr:hypothetical protein HF086_001145 [Spodoptera exigua]
MRRVIRATLNSTAVLLPFRTLVPAPGVAGRGGGRAARRAVRPAHVAAAERRLPRAARRLQAAPPAPPGPPGPAAPGPAPADLPFPALLEQFHAVQAAHREYRMLDRSRAKLLDKGYS